MIYAWAGALLQLSEWHWASVPFNMDHTDIIAYLYPHADVGKGASDAVEASSRYMPPRLKRTQSRYIRGERESTEPPEVQGASSLDYLPCLGLRFSDVPRTVRGLVFGYNPNCDVVLNYQGISNCHVSLTFDERRLIVKDCREEGRSVRSAVIIADQAVH